MSEPLEIPDDAVPRRAEGALEAEIDGDLVLLGPQDLDFFGTGGEGDHIWRLIEQEVRDSIRLETEETRAASKR